LSSNIRCFHQHMWALLVYPSASRSSSRACLSSTPMTKLWQQFGRCVSLCRNVDGSMCLHGSFWLCISGWGAKPGVLQLVVQLDRGRFSWWTVRQLQQFKGEIEVCVRNLTS
jgi:hypothetical protein